MTTTKPRLLIAFDTIEEAYPLFEQSFEVVRPPKGRDFTKEELLSYLGSFDALASVFDIPIDEELIDAGGSRLKIISNYAVGYNNIDLEAAKSKGIAVTNTPKSVVVPTAELTFALLLDVSRRVSELDRLLRTQKNENRITRLDRMGVDLSGKTLGIIGFGNIGREVARRAKAFDMQILYNKRTRLSAKDEQELGVTYSPIDSIFSSSDVVSLHTPLTSETIHLADRKRIFSMKPSAILLNLARGPVIDEEALVEALQKKVLFGAGLDVFEDKDCPHSALYALENVVMTPHVGTQTYDARMRMAKEVLENLEGFFFHQGKGVSFVVKP